MIDTPVTVITQSGLVVLGTPSRLTNLTPELASELADALYAAVLSITSPGTLKRIEEEGGLCR